MQQIARYVGSIIDDGSTLQIGLGRITNEALKHLADRQDLGIHSDVITDAIIPLIERGILTGRRKTAHVGKIDASSVGWRRRAGGARAAWRSIPSFRTARSSASRWCSVPRCRRGAYSRQSRSPDSGGARPPWRFGPAGIARRRSFLPT
jgi:hypothetical protein